MHLVQEINVVAMSKAVEAFVGPQATQLIGNLYVIIDRAMKDGYDLGKIDAEEKVEQRLDAAFDNGFMEGQTASENDGFDAGYLEGVSDARARPMVADETVAAIISDMTQQAINGEYDGALVQDSGDCTNSRPDVWDEA